MISLTPYRSVHFGSTHAGNGWFLPGSQQGKTHRFPPRFGEATRAGAIPCETDRDRESGIPREEVTATVRAARMTFSVGNEIASCPRDRSSTDGDRHIPRRKRIGKSISLGKSLAGEVRSRV
jgi:hypothetical protein